MAFYNSSQVQGDVELHSCQENCRLYAGYSEAIQRHDGVPSSGVKGHGSSLWVTVTPVNQAETEAVEAALEDLLNTSNSSNSTGIVATVVVNTSLNQELQLTLIDPAALAAVANDTNSSNSTLDIVSSVGTVSIPLSSLQEVAAQAGSERVILSVAQMGPTSEFALSSEVAGNSIVSLTFRTETGEPIQVSGLTAPVEFLLPASDNDVCLYWDEDLLEWSDKDIETAPNGTAPIGFALCRSRHFSIFGTGSPPPTTTSTSTSAPTTTTQAVATSTSAPATTTPSVATSTSAPASTTQAVATSTSAPASTTQAVATSTSAPATTTQSVATSTSAPATTTQAAATSTSAPATTTQAVTTQAPGTTTAADIRTTSAAQEYPKRRRPHSHRHHHWRHKRRAEYSNRGYGRPQTTHRYYSYYK
ncbi:Dana\GF13208 [Symbiodinium natans]|uniref:Dana\GF13208 protein n=1 Tax=Symbiodinium natans TaxID=878477 RepID=A0A812S9I6_9DINO|nr:Dana\GF13208 [Symbiodinium natans]